MGCQKQVDEIYFFFLSLHSTMIAGIVTNKFNCFNNANLFLDQAISIPNCLQISILKIFVCSFLFPFVLDFLYILNLCNKEDEKNMETMLQL